MDKETEARAAAAVAHALNARARRVDPGGGSVSSRDFDLVFRDRPDEPLELTSHTDQPVAHTWGRLEALDRDAPSLRRIWAIDMPSSEIDAVGRRGATDVARFMTEAEDALQELEAAGYERFDLGLIYRDPSVERAVRILASLGCQFGFSHPAEPGQPGRINPGSPVGGLVTAELVTAGVEAEAQKADNQNKLRQPLDAAQRHLLVLFDSSSGASFSAVSYTMESPVPRLPEPITTAWVAGQNRLFSVTPPDGWQEHQVPEEVYLQPERWIVG